MRFEKCEYAVTNRFHNVIHIRHYNDMSPAASLDYFHVKIHVRLFQDIQSSF